MWLEMFSSCKSGKRLTVQLTLLDGRAFKALVETLNVSSCVCWLNTNFHFWLCLEESIITLLLWDCLCIIPTPSLPAATGDTQVIIDGFFFFRKSFILSPKRQWPAITILLSCVCVPLSHCVDFVLACLLKLNCAFGEGHMGEIVLRQQPTTVNFCFYL